MFWRFHFKYKFPTNINLNLLIVFDIFKLLIKINSLFKNSFHYFYEKYKDKYHN